LDVSGHGVAAALLSVSLTRMIDQSSITISSLKGGNVSMKASEELLDPRKVIHKLNRRFPGDNSKFCTLLYAILDIEESSVTWIRAGHVPPLWIQDYGANASYLQEPGGLFISNLPYEDNYLQTQKIQLAPGDRFVLFSDGITEAMKDDEEYGYEKFEQVMLATASKPLDQSVQSVLNSLSQWTGSSKFEDDVTLLALEKISDAH
ncbi:MAG: PP2C family protein-serine/threonine phosphatase, partial [Candidatus Hinthialibacter sp.]